MKWLFIPKSRVAFTCESIPWADHLADVTSENPTASLFTQLGWNIILQFNGEIRNATSRVNCAVRKDAVRGAGINTACTCAAMIGNKRWIWFEPEIEKNF